MNKYLKIEEYEAYLKEFGFGDYMIDFSDVSAENAIKLCEFIKGMVIKNE